MLGDFSLLLNYVCRDVILWLRSKQVTTGNCCMVLKSCVHIHAHESLYSRHSRHLSKTTENNGSLAGDNISSSLKNREKKMEEKTPPYYKKY